jgi:hypothetical protein
MNLSASWPISETPETIISVKDELSNQPISGVLFAIHWWKRKFSLFDLRVDRYKTMYLMSDKEGMVKIPRNITFHILSSFDAVSVSIRHPFYETVFLRLDSGGGDKPILIRQSNQNSYSISIRSLREKYNNVKCAISLRDDFEINSCGGTANDLSVDIRNAEQYFVGLNQKRISGRKEEFIVNVSSAIAFWTTVGEQVYRESVLPTFLKFDERNLADSMGSDGYRSIE